MTAFYGRDCVVEHDDQRVFSYHGSILMISAKQRIGRLIFSRLPVTRFLFDQLRLESNVGMPDHVPVVPNPHLAHDAPNHAPYSLYVDAIK
jgi:hypothetical protein